MENPAGRSQRRVATVDAEADLYESGPPLPEGLTRWPMYVMSRAVQRGWVVLARKLAGAGLSPRLHALLVVVRDHGPVSQQAIGEMLRIDRTTMAATADAAEAAGYITRDRDRGDRRRYALRLTPAGEGAVAIADELVAEADAEFMAGLDDGERAVLHGLLVRIVPAAAAGYRAAPGVAIANDG